MASFVLPVTIEEPLFCPQVEFGAVAIALCVVSSGHWVPISHYLLERTVAQWVQGILSAFFIFIQCVK